METTSLQGTMGLCPKWRLNYKWVCHPYIGSAIAHSINTYHSLQVNLVHVVSRHLLPINNDSSPKQYCTVAAYSGEG